MQPGFYPASHPGVPPDPVGKGLCGLAHHTWNRGRDSADVGLVASDEERFRIARIPAPDRWAWISCRIIPIPRREGPVNPLANDTTSVVPQAPEPVVKVEKQVKAQPENAIPIPDKIDKHRKVVAEPKVQSLFRPPEPYKSNQVYSQVPQAAVSPMYGMKGSNGIDLGPESVLGTRFGAYTNLMRDRVAQHWNRANVHSLASQKCAISFTIARNGTVTNVQVSQPSGDYLLDTSAKRAVLDANPLPSLPPQFPGNEVTVELWFQLQ